MVSLVAVILVFAVVLPVASVVALEVALFASTACGTSAGGEEQPAGDAAVEERNWGVKQQGGGATQLALQQSICSLVAVAQVMLLLQCTCICCETHVVPVTLELWKRELQCT